MGIKRGDVRWRCNYDLEEGKINFDEMVCRTIRKPYTYWVQKINGITWVKLSSKSGDYGWEKNLHPIWRTMCWNGYKLSFYGFGTTKLAAARLALARERQGLKRWRDPTEEHYDEVVAEYKLSISKLEAYVKRHGRKK